MRPARARPGLGPRAPDAPGLRLIPPALQRWLGRRRVAALAALAAVLLTLPALKLGLQGDDHVHRTALLAPPESALALFHLRPWDLYRFASGDAADMLQRMDSGTWPWWTLPTLRVAFLRPLSSLSLWLDHRLWPDTPLLMHAQSLLLYGLLCAAVGALYAEVLRPRWAAALAALLYAADDAHGMVAGWLAHRNALIAALLAVLAVLLHVRWRRGSRGAGWLAAAALGAGLLAGEAALGACAYLFAYAVFIEEGPLARRLASLAPYGVLVVLWRLLYQHLGYGAFGSGLYLDPVREPGAYLGAVLWRAPALLLGQLLGPPSELWGMAPPPWLPAMALGAVAVLALVGWGLAAVVRASAEARFLLCGALLALAPVCGTVPADRLLLLVGVGAMGLVALLLRAVAERAAGHGARALAVVLVAFHCVLGPLLLPLRTWSMEPMERGVRRLERTLPPMDALFGHTYVVVSMPSFLPLSYALTLRLEALARAPGGWGDRPLPRVRLLGTALGPVDVERPDERTLRLRAEGGLLDDLFGHLLRGADHPLRPGEELHLTGLSILVEDATADGRPRLARFRFDVPLEDGSLLWQTWTPRGMATFTPPPVGGRVSLPPVDQGALLSPGE